MIRKDKRIKLMNEILNGIRVGLHPYSSSIPMYVYVCMACIYMYCMMMTMAVSVAVMCGK